MFPRSAACLIVAAIALSAFADPPRDEIAAANNLLRQGHPAEALESYRNLQIDDPESSLLYYNIGCAQMASALKANADDPVAAAEALAEARESFDKATMAEDPAVRRDARYNRVNSEAELAKQLGATEDFEGATKAFENAILGYEDFLEQYPDHEGAQQNLDHMRYLLKKMLQNPPEPQQQDQPQSGDEQKEGDSGDENQQQSQGEQGDQSGDQQEGDQQGDQQSGDQQGEQDDSQTSPDPSETGQNEQPQEAPGDDESETPGDPSQEHQPGQDGGADEASAGEMPADADPGNDETPVELPNTETIEAILDALKERDSQEQENMRRVPQDPRRTGPWW